MALCRCFFELRFPFNCTLTTTRTYSLRRKTQKKQYTYNLNNLIQWKKETHIAFGAERKMTKSGKMRKSKKSSLLNESLSVLSGCSSFNAYEVPGKEVLDLDIPSQVVASDVPIPEIVYHVGSSKPQSKSTFLKEEKQILKSSPDEHILTAETDTLIALKSNVHSSINNHTVSPLPMPASTASIQSEHEVNSAELTQCLEKVVSVRKKAVQPFGSTLAVNEKSFLNTNSSKQSIQVNRTFIDKTAEEDLSEIYIPKLAPIPQPKSSANNLLLYDMRPPLPVFESTSPLPIEPPDTYNMISKVPLFPKESASWSQQPAELDQLQAFHNDVRQLGFRTPPSVKSILSKSMPGINRFFLERWREKMIKELGEEGFQQHQEATIKRGSNLHANIQDYLSGKPLSEIQIMPDNQGHWVSLQSTFKTLSEVAALEVSVFHPLLLYKGVFDCVAKYKDLLCIIDWKVSKKSRPTIKDTYDDPLQIVAYMGAVNASNEYLHKFGQINHGMIVIAYPDGQPAHVHILDKTACKEYWRTWTDRLYDFYQLTYSEKFGKKMNEASSHELSTQSAS